MLALRNITFSIEGKKLFEEASALIPAGHKVGFVGRNGSGRTTLFRLIPGAERARPMAEVGTAGDAHRIAETYARLANIDDHSAEARAAALWFIIANFA